MTPTIHILDRLAAKLARKDSLALKLSQRPQRQELIERNILHMVTFIYISYNQSHFLGKRGNHLIY